MSRGGDIFRISIRFNKHEYSDVDQYLSRFSGANKGAHIRMLIRLGIQAMTGQAIVVPHGEPLPDTSPSAPHPQKRHVHSVKATPTSQPAPMDKAPNSGDAASILLDMGLDPSKFEFGAPR